MRWNIINWAYLRKIPIACTKISANAPIITPVFVKLRNTSICRNILPKLRHQLLLILIKFCRSASHVLRETDFIKSRGYSDTFWKVGVWRRFRSGFFWTIHLQATIWDLNEYDVSCFFGYCLLVCWRYARNRAARARISLVLSTLHTRWRQFWSRSQNRFEKSNEVKVNVYLYTISGT